MGKVVSTALSCSPGVQRDGTAFVSQAWLEGEWVRFVGEAPWKIGGLRSLYTSPGQDIVFQALSQYPQQGLISVVVVLQGNGTTPVLGFLPVQSSGEAVHNAGQVILIETASSPDVKAPASWFWSLEDFTAATNPGVGYPYPVMYVAPFSPCQDSLGNALPPVVGSFVAQNVFLADLVPFGTGSQQQIRQVVDPLMNEPVTTECGVGVINPGYVFLMYTGGTVVMNNPTAKDPVMTFSTTLSGITTWNEYVIGTTAVVACRSVMGNVPTGYFWTMDAVVLCQIGEDNQPSFSTAADGCSVMAPNTIVGVDNTFYWIGQNCFYTLKGQVQELRNTMNKHWFFESVSREWSALSFGVLNRQFSEIWWFVPMFGAKECNWAIIFNYASGIWSDTPFRASCGLDARYTPGPMVAGVRFQPSIAGGDGGDLPTLMAMEQGVDFVDENGVAHAIPAHLTSNFSSLYSQNTSMTESWINVKRLEVDIRMTGSLQVQMMAMHFPRDWTMGVPFKEQWAVLKEPGRGKPEDMARIFADYTITPSVRYVDFSLQGRLVGIRFSMNETGGDFRFGSMMLDWTVGSGNSGGKEVPFMKPELVAEDSFVVEDSFRFSGEGGV